MQLLESNGLLSTGLLLMVAGMAASVAHRLFPYAVGWLSRTFSTSIQVRDDRLFVWLGDWIHSLGYGERCRALSVDVEYTASPDRRAGSESRAVFAPGRGVHVFRHRGRWFWLTRRQEATKTTEREFYELRTLGRDPGILKAVVREAAQRAQDRRKGKVGVWIWDSYDDWREVQVQESRSLGSIVLPDGVKEDLVADLERFRESRTWYADLGIPYRRGYLFHGPPGCGKTSVARALASHFGMNIYLVNLASAEMSDERLMDALNKARPDSILLIEDVDAAFQDREGTRQAAPQLTFSGLLNAIDGVAAQEGRILIMTTNHPERLDPALIRPGRVDVKQAFERATPEQVRELFVRFYPDQRYLANRLAERVPPRVVSVATLQGIFLQARDRPVLAVRGVLEELGRRPKELPAVAGFIQGAGVTVRREGLVSNARHC